MISLSSIHYHPSSYTDEAKANFIKILDTVTKPVALIQHDHSMLSIRRNGALDESIKRANVIFVHSKTNDFAKYVEEVRGMGGLDSFFGGDDNSVPIHGFQPGLDFEPIFQKYWKDISEQDAMHHKWIGRTTSWKGYKEMFRLHANYLQPKGFLTTFEGIERSPAYLGFRELGEFEPLINEEIDDYDLSKAYGDKVQVFGPYKQEPMLERMSKVGFGYQLSLLKPQFIERSIEYTHCEVVCTGTIPVFRKKYGEKCIHREHGKPLIECRENGTIWLDDDNMEECLDTIEMLNRKPKTRELWRQDAYEFYKLHQDAKYTFSELTKLIITECQ